MRIAVPRIRSPQTAVRAESVGMYGQPQAHATCKHGHVGRALPRNARRNSEN